MPSVGTGAIRSGCRTPTSNGVFVQVKLEFEEYKNRTRIKVRYIDPENASPTEVPKSNDQSRSTISMRLGAKFRANAGGTPAPAPAPNGSPATKTAATAESPQTATMQEAWAVFVKACPEGSTQAQTEKEWFRILGDLFPGKQPQDLTPQEWGIFINEGPSRIIPF